MKHSFNRLLLGAALSALLSANAYAQTRPADSTGVTPWQGTVQLRAGQIDPALLAGGSGATILRPFGACTAFTNQSSTIAISVAVRHGGFAGDSVTAYVNSQPMATLTGSRNYGMSTANVIVPPMHSFATWGGRDLDCAYTALSNNVTAQSVGFRYVTSSTFTWTSQNYVACYIGGYAAGYGFTTSYYNYGAPSIGPSEYKQQDLGCQHDTSGGGGSN